MNAEGRGLGSITGTAAFDLMDEKNHGLKSVDFRDILPYRWIVPDV
jgi:hypothetical protein